MQQDSRLADIGETTKEILLTEGLRILTGVTAKRVSHRRGNFAVELDDGVVEAEALLIACGRRLQTDALDLANCGVLTDSNGAIIVDDSLRTNIAHIYAAGDCTNLPQFVYVAAASGMRAAVNILGGRCPP